MTRDEQIRELLENIDKPVKDELVPQWWIQNIFNVIDQVFVLLQDQPCQTCGGSGEVGTELCKVGFDGLGERTIPCPDCPEKK